MNRASTILFALGFLIAIVSAAGMYFVLTSAQPKPVVADTVPILLAFQTIPGRTEITAEQVGLGQWPKTIPTPTGAFDSPENAVGKMALNPIYPGQAIINRDLLDKQKAKETHSNAAYILDKGTVAIAVPVSIRSNIAQAVQPGDRVDILVSFPVPRGAAPTLTTQRLLEDVLVLQVGTWPSPAADTSQGQQAGKPSKARPCSRFS
jgi:Flp pilus assembly protein CpaB